MHPESRTILSAYDSISQAKYKADIHLEKTGEQFHEQSRAGNVHPTCYECHQELAVYRHTLGFYYFRHLNNSEDCPLKYLTSEQAIEYRNWIKSKESEQHIKLKNLVATKLKKEDGVDPESVFIDDRFIKDSNNRRRKPDVYCEYQGKRIAFEIQLSPLPRRIIDERNTFYEKLGIYLMWIMEDVDIDVRRNLDIDIRTRNVFNHSYSINTASEVLGFYCLYPLKKISQGQEIRREYEIKEISFPELKFDQDSFQLYYFDAPITRDTEKSPSLQLSPLSNVHDTLYKEEIDNESVVDPHEASVAAKEIQEQIKIARKAGAKDYSSIQSNIRYASSPTISKLNDILNLEDLQFKESPFIIGFIHHMSMRDFPFLMFILKTFEIKLDVNQLCSKNGSALNAICDNSNLTRDAQFKLMKALAGRIYQLKESDIDTLDEQLSKDRFNIIETFTIKTWLRSRERSDAAMDLIVENIELIRALESIYNFEILVPGIEDEDWYGFARHCLETYENHWKYFRKALHAQGLATWLVKNYNDQELSNKLRYIETHFHFYRDKSPLTELLRGLFVEFRF